MVEMLVIFCAGLLVAFAVFYFIKPELPETSPNYAEYNLEYPVPRTIEKPAVLKDAETKLEIKREIEMEDDGTVVVKAVLVGLNNVDGALIFEDFVENVKFDTHVNIVSGSVTALNGTVFPAGDGLNAFSYGPGPVDSKKTGVSVALLNLNFSSLGVDAALYELRMKVGQDVNKLIFDSSELRSGKYILKLNAEEVYL